MENKGNILSYAIVAVAIAVVVWAALSTFGLNTGKTASYNSNQASSQGMDAMHSSGMNAGECGDLNEVGNVQHLSHHPSQYADCLKQVSPTVFKQATGTDKEAFMQQNGI
ncbi:Uncharacterised protein [uncultured archaeon]|nr:Uncharacterised protein [uncultured archaeon]